MFCRVYCRINVDENKCNNNNDNYCISKKNDCISMMTICHVRVSISVVYFLTLKPTPAFDKALKTKKYLALGAVIRLPCIAEITGYSQSLLCRNARTLSPTTLSPTTLSPTTLSPMTLSPTMQSPMTLGIFPCSLLTKWTLRHHLFRNAIWTPLP